MAITERGKRWEILHSLWLGWMLTIGFLNWIAFLYIGFRVKQKKWIFWGLFYSIPFVVFVVYNGIWQWDLLYTIMNILGPLIGIVTIIHAFRVRREYLLRLEASSLMTRDIPTTSKGERWEILHSLWIGWTFTLSFFNWVAFLYIGLRAKQWKWILWGLFYSTPLVTMISIGPPASLPTWLANLVGFLFLGLGIVSIFHAFWIRRGYLVRLEALQREVSENEADFKQQLESEINQREIAPGQSTATPEKADHGSPHRDPQEQAAPSSRPARPSPSTAPNHPPVEVNNTLEQTVAERPNAGPISAQYPLPLAYSYRLVEAEFETVRILKELYRNAEGLTAFLASLALALAPTPAGQTKKGLLSAWRGKGATFGNWFSILSKTTSLIDEERGPLYRSTKQLLGTDQNPTPFAEDMRWLIDRRDEFHHGNLPVGDKADQLVREVRKRFEHCVSQSTALWQHPLRLVLDYDAVRNSDHVMATCLDFSGDHPVGRKVQENYRGIPKKQDLYILQNEIEWISLYPFISVQYCPYCQSRETYLSMPGRAQEKRQT